MGARPLHGPAYRIRRSSRARRVRLMLTREGEAVVVLPHRAPERWAHELVRARAGWLARHLQRIEEERARIAARLPLAEGRPLALGGIPHRLEVVPLSRERRRSRISHEDGPDPVVRIELAAGDERPLDLILAGWLRDEARATVERRIAVRAPQLGVTPGSVTIRDQRSRWGSASRRGNLSFSWRLVLAPAAVLDYVVVHELAHLADFSHSPRFWALVRRAVPEADAARRWLRSHEVELRSALD